MLRVPAGRGEGETLPWELENGICDGPADSSGGVWLGAGSWGGTQPCCPSSLTPTTCTTCPPFRVLSGKPRQTVPCPSCPTGGVTGAWGPLSSPAGVNVMLRKIAVAAASKPAVEIKQEGDTFYIKTSTTVRTTEINFKIGEEFEEQTVDGRPCKVRPQGHGVCCPRLLACQSGFFPGLGPLSISRGESP